MYWSGGFGTLLHVGVSPVHKEGRECREEDELPVWMGNKLEKHKEGRYGGRERD